MNRPSSSANQDADPTRLIPELLEQLISLGDLARQINRSLGDNGHRAEVAAALVKHLKHQANR